MVPGAASRPLVPVLKVGNCPGGKPGMARVFAVKVQRFVEHYECRGTKLLDDRESVPVLLAS